MASKKWQLLMPLLTTFSSPLICSLCASNDISILINNAKLFFDVTVNQIDCYTNDSFKDWDLTVRTLPTFPKNIVFRAMTGWVTCNHFKERLKMPNNFLILSDYWLKRKDCKIWWQTWKESQCFCGWDSEWFYHR